MERKPRRRFSREFKMEALRRWRAKYEADPTHAFGGSGRVAPRDAEVVDLKRELARVKRERDFLKSAAVFFAKESR